MRRSVTFCKTGIFFLCLWCYFKYSGNLKIICFITAPSNLQAAFCTWPVSWKIFQFLSKEHKCWTWSIERLNIKMIAKHRIMFYCPIFNGLKWDIWKRKSHILAIYSNYHFNALINIHTKPFQPCWCENLVFGQFSSAACSWCMYSSLPINILTIDMDRGE